MLMETTDETLALAARSGDRAAFGVSLARHYDRVFRLAWRLSGSRADAEDLAQEVCAVLPVKLASWRGEVRFSTWLYRVVMNAAHDQRRRASVRAKASDGWGDWEIARQDEISAEAERLDWLTAAMTQLSPELCDTVVLILAEEMTQAEAAR